MPLIFGSYKQYTPEDEYTQIYDYIKGTYRFGNDQMHTVVNF